MIRKLLIGLLICLCLPGLVKAEADNQNVGQQTSGTQQQVRERVEIMQQTRAEEREEKRERLRLRLEQLQDQHKARMAAGINAQLNQINQRWTAAMSRMLERLRALVDKLESRLAKMEAEGSETTGAETAITTAKTAIATAQAAVDEQIKKEYIIEFIDESGLRIGASEAKTNLRTDLRAVKELVKTARQAVVEALKVVKLTGELEGE